MPRQTTRNQRRARRRAGQRKQFEDATRPLMLAPFARDTYRMVRTVDVGNLSSSATDKGWIWNFALTDLPSSSEITALFDQWCLDRVDLIFTWAEAVGTTAVYYPIMYIAPDYDQSGGTPSSIGDIMQRRHYTISFTPNKSQHTLSLKPRVSVDTGNTTGVLMPVGTFVDCAVGGTWRGAVAWIANFNTTNGGIIRLEERYHFRARGLR